MSNDNNSSSDVEAVEAEVTESDLNSISKPLLRLLKHLIDNSTNQNMILTNAKIINILRKEFNINTDIIHEMEIDIYVSIVKKFLKEWPQWDSFGNVITNLKLGKDKEAINTTLENKYLELKEYLKSHLDIAAPMAKEKVQILAEQEKPDSSEEFMNVVLEVSSTRQQLYQLFYRYPHPEHSSIINSTAEDPSTISMENFEFTDIFSWWDVGIIINCKPVHLTWTTTHSFNHILVNKKLKFERNAEPVYQGITERCYGLHNSRPIKKKLLKNVLDKILSKSYSISYVPIYAISLLFNIISKELDMLPMDLKLPCQYRKCLSKYPFVRYFKKELPDKVKLSTYVYDKYDIQLEETIIPRTELFLKRFDPTAELAGYNTQHITLMCISCNLSFTGHSMLETLKLHVLNNHFFEKEWQCLKCKASMSTAALIKMKWNHDCDESVQ